MKVKASTGFAVVVPNPISHRSHPYPADISYTAPRNSAITSVLCFHTRMTRYLRHEADISRAIDFISATSINYREAQKWSQVDLAFCPANRKQESSGPRAADAGRPSRNFGLIVLKRYTWMMQKLKQSISIFPSGGQSLLKLAIKLWRSRLKINFMGTHLLRFFFLLIFMSQASSPQIL
jgi:hypothetical protein